MPLPNRRHETEHQELSPRDCCLNQLCDRFHRRPRGVKFIEEAAQSHAFRHVWAAPEQVSFSWIDRHRTPDGVRKPQLFRLPVYSGPEFTFQFSNSDRAVALSSQFERLVLLRSDHISDENARTPRLGKSPDPQSGD